MPNDMTAQFDADDGTRRTVYFDYGYNSTLGLMECGTRDDDSVVGRNGSHCERAFELAAPVGQFAV